MTSRLSKLLSFSWLRSINYKEIGYQLIPLIIISAVMIPIIIASIQTSQLNQQSEPKILIQGTVVSKQIHGPSTVTYIDNMSDIPTSSVVKYPGYNTVTIEDANGVLHDCRVETEQYNNIDIGDFIDCYK